MYYCIRLILAAGLLTAHVGFAQDFVRTSDNAIADFAGPSQYTGASWVDIDGDGDLDLFVNNSTVFRNDGEENFESVSTAIGTGFAIRTGNGNTWADYDNDGDLDVLLCNDKTVLFRNDGGFTFVAVQEGDLDSSTAARGWSCAFSDYNNDGYVDFAVTHPAGFVPPTNSPTSNHLFTNDGPPNYTFTRVTNTPITTGFAAYTVGTWSDFDLDGDQDYHVGAGPANGTFATDFLYRNLLTETGTANFERITDSPLGTDLQDGQVWNWVDFDNDGDLDGFLTNWGGASGGRSNRLYVNDNGTYTNQTQSPAVTDKDVSLGQVWADFDNDGDLDLFIGNDSSQPGRYYENQNASLVKNTSIQIAESVTRRGMAAGDYDNDGDIDLVTVGPGTGSMRLYRNEMDTSNTYLKIRLEGTSSNRSGLGAKVTATAQIGGQSVTQLRELQSQTGFNSQNALEIHFGFGDATVINNLEITWPSGVIDKLEAVGVNQTLTVVEGQYPVSTETLRTPVIHPQIVSVYPNPVHARAVMEFELAESGFVAGLLIDALGRSRGTLFETDFAAGRHRHTIDVGDLPNGVYLIVIEASGQSVYHVLVVVN